MLKRLHFLAASLLICFGALGCGSDKTVTVGAGEEKGVYQKSIDKAREVANGASQKIKSGEKDVYGG